jgi:hypothetical protein
MIVDRRIVPAAFTDMQEVRVNFAFLLIHELSPTPSWSHVQPRASPIVSRSAWLNLYTQLTAPRLGDKYFFRLYIVRCCPLEGGARCLLPFGVRRSSAVL